MRHLKTVFYLVCCFLIGIGISKMVSGFRGITADAFETPHVGIGNAPRLRGFCLPLNPGTAGAIAAIPSEGLSATAMSLSYPTSGTAGKMLAEAAAAAHHKKMEVILVPPGVFAKGNPYPQALEQIAREAEAARVNVLCLSWLNAEPDMGYWKREAEAVRRVYKGKLVFGGTPEIVVGLDKAEGFDFLGAIGPVKLARRLPSAPDDVDLWAMRVFWDCELNSLESQSRKLGVSLMLLNTVVPATIQGRFAAAGSEGKAEANPVLQMAAYEALFMQTKGRTAVEGLFLPWTTGPGVAEEVGVNRFPELLKRLEGLWSPASAVPVVPVSTAPVEGEGEE